MTVSVIVNTAALGEVSAAVLSSGGVQHGLRTTLLRERLLPRLLRDPDVGEVIVVGEWESGEGYRYVPCNSVNYDCTDALEQRQRGFEASTGRLVVFLHDDHIPADDFFQVLREYDVSPAWDVLVPIRRALDSEGSVHNLENGRQEGYVMGHCSVLRRAVCERAPWRRVPKVYTWDICATLLWRDANAKILWADDLVVYDLEASLGAKPWEPACP